MSSRPLTPPCVPFGTRRFNRISASYESARIGPESHSIRLVRAFRLLWNISESHFRLFSNSRDVCFPTGKPGILGYSISLGSVSLFSASSIVSRYTSETFCAAIHSSFAIFVSSQLRNSSRSSHEYSPSARPPRVRAITFLPCICRIYNAKFGQYWTLSCLADSSALHCLLCDFCSSDREFARVGTSLPPHPASFRFHLTMDTLAFG